jgi:hypothetical protein
MPGFVRCPECGTSMPLPPGADEDWVAPFGALGVEGCCWYSRGIAALSQYKTQED